MADHAFSARRCRIAAFAALCVCAMLMSGCLHYHVSRSESGKYVDGRVFARITPGKTSSGWVQVTIGEPTDIKKTLAGTEIWRWTYSRRKSIDGQYVVVRDRSTSVYHRDASVEVRDGIVINKWFDDRDVSEETKIN